jgi:hypothetical protein
MRQNAFISTLLRYTPLKQNKKKKRRKKFRKQKRERYKYTAPKVSLIRPGLTLQTPDNAAIYTKLKTTLSWWIET